MSDTDFFLNQTGGSISNQLGTRLNNFKNQVLSTQSVIGVQPDNSTDAIPYTAFGKSLLNVSTLNGLVGLINSADTNVSVIDSGTGEINFTLDNALKLVVKNLYTEVLNELRTLNVKPATDLGADLGDANKRYNTGFIRKITTNSVGQVSIGDGASTLGTSSVNIGNGSGGSGAPDYSVCIGRGANSEQSHTSSICLGYASGQKGTAQRSGIVAIGHSAGTGITGVQGMLNNAIAIGASASLNGGGVDSVAIGAGANGNSVANSYSVAIGSGAGSAGQGSNCIAIGQLAGQTNQNNNTIILNATGVAVNSSGTDRCHIAPIRSGGTGNALNYDTGSKEVLSGGNISMQTLTSQGLNPDILNSRDIGTTSLPWNGVYCNGLIQPSATNAMTFNTNSAERMRISSSGNLGIGTSNPTERLTVQSSSYPAIIIKDTSNASDYISIMRDHGANKNIIRNSGRLDIETPANYTRMTFLGDGTLGINNTAPTEKLDVVGNVKISAQLAIGTSVNSTYTVDVRRTGVDNYQRISGDVAKKQGLIFSDGATPTDVWTFYKKETTKTLNIYNNTTASDLMTFTQGNLVGLGTATPVYNLHINPSGTSAFAGNDKKGLLITDSTVPRILLENLGNDSGKRLSAIQNLSGIWSVGVLNDTGGSWNKERILGLNLSNYDATFAGDILTDSIGDKDIGSTANPFGKLHTVDADISNLVSNVKTMNLTPTATNTYTIGASSSTQYSAIYGNSIYANGVILTSDINKKKNIQPIEDALSIIMRFESKSFKFKDGTSNRTHTGFIAQQIKEVIPDDWALYCDNKLGDIGLKYTEVIPLNTRAIQQLNERLSKVESRKLVGSAIIDTSGLTEDMVSIYQRLEALEIQKPQLHRCIEVSRINELFERISNLECNESKSNSSEDFELMHSLMEKNHQQELRINELENKLNQIQSQPKVESKSVDFLAESDGGLNMMDMLQTKNYEMEQRILKLEKQNKKLVQAVNRLLKTTDE